MTIESDLLAGPRGRRFCWELVRATGHPHEGDSTLFWAEYHLARRRGAGVVLFGPGSDQPAPEPSAHEVARAHDALLDAAHVDAASVDDVLRALARTADSAMWWQAPDEQDALLADAVPEETTARAVRAVSATAAVRTVFTAPSDPRWWTVEPERPWAAEYPDPVRPPSATVALRDAHRALLDEQLSEAGSADSGEWWTTPPSALRTTTHRVGDRGPLALWAVEDHTGWERADVAAVEVDPAARVFEVDDADDWAVLCRRFPIDVTGTTRRHDWGRATGRQGAWVVPDWNAVADHFDAVHLTLRGWLRASGVAVQVDDRTASVIAGWTPDQAVWLRDPQPMPGPASRWEFDREHDGWVTA